MPARGELPPARFQQFSRAVAAAVVGVGVAVLFGIDFLKSMIWTKCGGTSDRTRYGDD